MWNPYLIKDTVMLERIQRQATKFILRGYDSDYKTRLLKLDLLPLIYMLDFYDIIFFIKALKQPSDHFNILHYVTFSTINTFHQQACSHLYQQQLHKKLFTLTDYLGYGINYHSLISISHYQLSEPPSIIICNNIFKIVSYLTFHAPIIFVVDVQTAII